MDAHFALVEKIKETQPSEFVACFSHKELFAEYGYKASQFDYKWVWIHDRLLKENVEELRRLFFLCRA